ncbi:MAG: haloacid dehalogenase type II [Planctomycetes bacterium]|nr:haloacid dehalogenase type II [Planctomycetota bacterium]
MAELEQVLKRIDTITFDCYGTLISWAAGLESSLRSVFGDALPGQQSELFEAYVAAEAEIESGSYRPYRDVLADVVRRLAARFSLDLPEDRVDRMSQDLPNWPPFSDTVGALRRLKAHYRLGILSNIDRDLFAATAQRLSVPFDFVVTAEDVKSYKPGRAHFDRLLTDHANTESVLHVAQSLFHDGEPAQALGIAFVWINRYNEVNKTSVKPLAEFANLASLADAACPTW